MIAVPRWEAAIGGLVDQLAAGLGAAELDEHRPGLRQGGGAVGLVQRAGTDHRLLGEEQGLLGIGRGEPVGQPLQGVLALARVGRGQHRQRLRAVELGEHLGRRLADPPVVAMSVIGRPLQGELRVDPGHVQDAGRCAVLFGVLAELLPEPDQDPPGEGPLILEARRRLGLPRGGRLGRLEQRDRQSRRRRRRPSPR